MDVGRGLTYNQLRNLVTFVALMRGEDMSWSGHEPGYVQEKFERYLGGTVPDDDRWRWGVHPILAEHIDRYFEYWNVPS